MSKSSEVKDVQLDWPSVVPLGDTLAVKTDKGVDEGWVKAFEVVLDEHNRRGLTAQWTGIDYAPATKDSSFVMYVRSIMPGVDAFELRRTLDDLVSAANKVALVGTHVYDLARELRQQIEPPQAASERGKSLPPPTAEEEAAALRADAA